ncbi:unnamed protein product (mitochondrion) [Plasmodiophora brassicae]|uniref:Uncharacterized protein n=1 Tax=Plasmodiophora brassicae TaxID=37360 RepID=A0A3P3YGH4_PLABS|nr:unnamed protein product [Plasmodiophora brassicae]
MFRPAGSTMRRTEMNQCRQRSNSARNEADAGSRGATGVPVTSSVSFCCAALMSSSTPIDGYVKEIVDSRAHLHLNTKLSPADRTEAEIGLALTLAMVQKCQDRLRQLEICSGAGGDDAACDKERAALQSCIGRCESTAIDDLLRDHATSPSCDAARLAHNNDRDDPAVLQRLLHCCARASLDQVARDHLPAE